MLSKITAASLLPNLSTSGHGLDLHLSNLFAGGQYTQNSIRHLRSSPECPMTAAGSGANPASFRAWTLIRYGTKVGVPETMYLDTFATTTDVHSSSPSFWRQLTLYWRPGPLDSKPFKGYKKSQIIRAYKTDCTISYWNGKFDSQT